MEVPSPTSINVVAGQGRDGYVQGSLPAGGLGAGVASALKGLGSSLQALGERTDQLNERTDRFNTLKDMTDWETYINNKSELFKRDYQADGKDFANAWMKMYDEESQRFLNERVKPELRPEMGLRLAQTRQGVAANSLSFQYKQSDAWFRQGVSDIYNKGLTEVAKDPTQLDTWQKKISEQIDASDLTPADKETLKRNTSIGLLALKYKDDRKNGVQAPIDGNMSEFDATRALIRKHEGWLDNAKFDVNHYRVGYSSDTITDATGRVRPVQQGDTVTQADADRDLARRLTSQSAFWRNQTGEAWDALPNNIKAAIHSVTWNYGEDAKDLRGVIAAVKTGDTEMIARAVESLGANTERRKQEAAVIRGGAMPDSDPRYDSLPFDVRTKMDAQADTELRQEAADQKAQQTAHHDIPFNDLLVGINDGRYDESDIKTARDQGWLSDYDDIVKATKARKDFVDGQSQSIAVADSLQRGVPILGTNEEVNKSANSWANQQGLTDKLLGGDEGAARMLQRFINVNGMMPSAVSDSLTRVALNGKWDQSQIALGHLLALREANPDVYERVFPASVKAMVTRQGERINGAAPEKDAQTYVKGPLDPAERKAYEDMRTFAAADFDRVEKGERKGAALFAEAVDEIGGEVPPGSMMAQSMMNEFRALYIEQFALTGNADTALAESTRILKTQWKPTVVGGNDTVMKLPPESVMPTVGKSYAYLDRDVRKQMGLTAADNVSIVTDQQTEREYKSGKPVSWSVLKQDQFGVWRKLPERWVPKIPEKEVQLHEDALRTQNAIAKLERENEILQTPQYPRQPPPAMVGEGKQRYEDNLKEIQRLRGINAETQQEDPQVKARNIIRDYEQKFFTPIGLFDVEGAKRGRQRPTAAERKAYDDAVETLKLYDRSE